ncbi:trophoblast glycoprotein b [Myxocyprinus asiaticus]|uniref:trophoblast glycoprotein b n=1 Tax=Myxocyprinus asiaticus TaxID=70543 RepID=UPI0022230359|nr:trophoblast glycoprotein b [Myxocyprinus asiaticus]
MCQVGLSRFLKLERKQMSICNLTLCVLLFLTCFCSPSSSCPVQCSCEATTVNCVNQDLRSIPQNLPEIITTLNISGNNIRSLNNESFPRPLEHLTNLYVSGSQVEQLDSVVFDNLPSLRLLDLSNNRIMHFNIEAFPQDNKVEVLNLSRSLYNHSYVSIFANLFKHSLPKVSHLDLSNNDLMLLPEGMFTDLSELTILDLRNNSLVEISTGTFQSWTLQELDLRDNAFKVLPNSTLAELSSIPDLQVRLAGNPWRCDCNIEDMLIWLKKHDFVADKINMTCSDPIGLQNSLLLHLEQSQLPCTYTGDLKGVLETSYVFLGMVLALIGVIFLLVLYLNRKGIKKWMYNIRDACRDHMEGYHYRYEINSEPRLANLSLNSDV